jgi:hypothetical protein
MRYTIVLTSLVSAFTFAAPSFAADTGAAQGDRACAHATASFPMTGATFKEHIDARVAKARAAMEARAQSATSEEAKELRAKFDAGVARVNQEVGAAIADGTVTAEEAQKVRAAMRPLHGGRKHSKG